MDTFVERDEIQVLRLRANWSVGGPADAFRRLEARLDGIRGRKFYGTFRMLPEGEEYFACVERRDGDDPVALGLEVGTIAGGLHLRRKLTDWPTVAAAGKIGEHFMALLSSCRPDRTRCAVEFYRSSTELHLLEPVLNRERPRTSG
jgi:hypothetical protein